MFATIFAIQNARIRNQERMADYFADKALLQDLMKYF